jgi:tetratricopeptide (TPR) repeat protein
MPSFETLVFVGVFGLLAVAGLSFLIVLRSSRGAPAVSAFEAGRFAEAVELARSKVDAGRGSLIAGARAARHLLDFGAASGLLDKLLREDPEDGEAWMERGLVAAYRRDPDDARDHFQRAATLRSDLLESITLHRAWVEHSAGDATLARRLFEEVEQPIITKLDTDLGAGDPDFAEWFLHAGWLWRARGDESRAQDAIEAARNAAPESRLPDLLDTFSMPTATSSST